jgi:hypothetical protein
MLCYERTDTIIMRPLTFVRGDNVERKVVSAFGGSGSATSEERSDERVVIPRGFEPRLLP